MPDGLMGPGIFFVETFDRPFFEREGLFSVAARFLLYYTYDHLIDSDKGGG